MSTRAVCFTALACALLGGWLPSLWLSPPLADSPRPLPVLVSPPPSSPPPAQESLAALVRRQRSPMAKLQAVITGMAGRHFDPAASLRELEGLGFGEAEEVAGALAGEAAGRKVRDGMKFIEALEQQGISAFQLPALASWTETDPDGALNHLVKMSGNWIWYRYYFICRLAEQNPDKVLAVLKTAAPSTDLKYVWSAAIVGCMNRSRAFGLQVLLSAPAGVRLLGTQRSLESLAEADPRAALAWRESLPPELREGTKTGDVFRTWAKSDPAAAVREWESQNGTKEQPYELLSIWTERDPEGLLQWARQKNNGGAIVDAMASLTRIDPDRALQLLAGASAAERKEMLPAMGRAMAGRDAPAALAWMRSLPAEERPDVLKGMLPNLTTLPAAEGRVLAQEIGTGSPDGFRLLYQADRAEAEKTLAALPPVEALTICKSMSAHLAETPAAAAPFVTALVQSLADPASAADVAKAPADPNAPKLSPGSSGRSSAALELDGPAGDPATTEVVDIVAGMASQWATLDPPSVSKWIATLPEGKPQTAAAVNLALAWGRHDVAAARAWVEQLPAGAAHDKAAEQITRIAKSSGGTDKNP